MDLDFLFFSWYKLSNILVGHQYMFGPGYSSSLKFSQISLVSTPTCLLRRSLLFLFILFIAPTLTMSIVIGEK